jgi:hypothetical protein
MQLQVERDEATLSTAKPTPFCFETISSALSMVNRETAQDGFDAAIYSLNEPCQGYEGRFNLWTS